MLRHMILLGKMPFIYGMAALSAPSLCAQTQFELDCAKPAEQPGQDSQRLNYDLFKRRLTYLLR